MRHFTYLFILNVGERSKQLICCFLSKAGSAHPLISAHLFQWVGVAPPWKFTGLLMSPPGVELGDSVFMDLVI